MIYFLEGILVTREPPKVVVAVGGMGYEIQVPLSMMWQLPEIGKTVKIFTQLIIREDSHTLYGFSRVSDKTFFNELLKVNGIGPKVALAILSGLSVEECHQAILAKNIQAFTAIPGIGKKTAERLMMEMQDKLEGVNLGAFGVSASSVAQREAMEALLALGYTSKEAQKAITSVKEGADNTEVLIKKALQGLVAG